MQVVLINPKKEMSVKQQMMDQDLFTGENRMRFLLGDQNVYANQFNPKTLNYEEIMDKAQVRLHLLLIGYSLKKTMRLSLRNGKI